MILQRAITRAIAPTVALAVKDAVVAEFERYRLDPIVTLEMFRGMAFAQGLRDLFNEKYFDICKFDKLVRIAGVTPDRKLSDALGILHCVHWDTMPAELREATKQQILILFTESQIL